VPNIEAQLANAKFLHGPLREKNCIACHQAHGSNNPKILDKAFPATFYEPYKAEAYDLCFACHDKKIVLNEKSTDTGFRNGDINLHFLHVNREKGRTCRACHDEHASNQPKHIREEVPFGRWTMKVQYNETPTGGGCTTGCHVPYKYDRMNPVTNPGAPKT
jgi:predicted CXXCH cytochrome family protein